MLMSTLKELRHEDFAILGQFCEKIITKCLHSYTKCSCKTMKKISIEFYQKEPTMIFSGLIFEDSTSKLEKIGPIFFKFQSISVQFAIGSNRRRETVSVP